MSALPYTLTFPSLGCVVVHAGLVPGVELHDQDAEAMSCMRNVVEVEGGGGYEPRTLPTQGVWPGQHTEEVVLSRFFFFFFPFSFLFCTIAFFFVYWYIFVTIKPSTLAAL